MVTRKKEASYLATTSLYSELKSWRKRQKMINLVTRKEHLLDNKSLLRSISFGNVQFPCSNHKTTSPIGCRLPVRFFVSSRKHGVHIYCKPRKCARKGSNNSFKHALQVVTNQLLNKLSCGKAIKKWTSCNHEQLEVEQKSRFASVTVVKGFLQIVRLERISTDGSETLLIPNKATCGKHWMLRRLASNIKYQGREIPVIFLENKS